MSLARNRTPTREALSPHALHSAQWEAKVHVPAKGALIVKVRLSLCVRTVKLQCCLPNAAPTVYRCQSTTASKPPAWANVRRVNQAALSAAHLERPTSSPSLSLTPCFPCLS